MHKFNGTTYTYHPDIFLLLGYLLINWTSNTGKTYKGANKSRVERFEYGGYDDTVYALIYGKVYEMERTADGRDTLKPLVNVEVRVEQNNKVTQTDNNGEFEIGLEKGSFSLIVSKQGYEPIQLTNCISDPDQISSTEIVLVRGKEQRTFEIPKWTR